ncbi:uncharacterized protein TNCV_2249221 [Trichonephila clavipes]|nr:uncharacterized protein TNCV_2249221 [Trichonephila clavipes]
MPTYNQLLHRPPSEAPSEGTVSTFTRDPEPSRTIRRRLAEGHLGSRCSLLVLPLTPIHRRCGLEWCHAQGNWTVPEWNHVVI